MKFNEKEGALVADEQGSSQSRKYDFIEKTHELEFGDNKVLYGGAGSADFIYSVVKIIEQSYCCFNRTDSVSSPVLNS